MHVAEKPGLQMKLWNIYMWGFTYLATMIYGIGICRNRKCCQSLTRNHYERSLKSPHTILFLAKSFFITISGVYDTSWSRWKFLFENVNPFRLCRELWTFSHSTWRLWETFVMIQYTINASFEIFYSRLKGVLSALCTNAVYGKISVYPKKEQ